MSRQTHKRALINTFFQVCTFKESNIWSMRMPPRMSWISRPFFYRLETGEKAQKKLKLNCLRNFKYK